jgi:hypothetical protein
MKNIRRSACKIESRSGFAVQQSACCAWLGIIVFVVLGLPFTCSASADGLSQYRDFVSNPPWIKKMVFARSGLDSTPIQNGKTETSHPVPGFVLFNAAVQSNTWYLEYATNSPFGEKDPLLGNGYTVGKSFQDYWSVKADRKTFTLCSIKESENSPPASLIKVSPNPAVGGPSSIGRGGPCALKGVTENSLGVIQEIQKMGLVYLEPGRIKDLPQAIEWLDNTNFKAETTMHGIIKGKIAGLTNGFPAKVEFAFSQIPRTTFTVIYDYKSDRPFPPSLITAYKTKGTNTEQLWEFQIVDIETGISDTGFNGFSPENFMSSNQIAMATKFIQGNGGKPTKMILPNGTVTNLSSDLPNYSILRAFSKGKVMAARIIMWSFIAVSFAVLFWAAKKTIKK